MEARFEDFTVFADGLEATEGPVILPDGTLYIVQSPFGFVTRFGPDRKRTDINVGDGPNGLALGPDGAIYIANSGHRSGPRPAAMLERALQRVNMPKPNAPPRKHGGYIQRLDPKTDKFETLYDSNSGAGPILAPNDLVFDEHGGIYFTDHGYDGPTGRNYGGIFYCKADGSFIERMDFHFSAPNGIGISPDGKTLYMADSFLGRLWAFDIIAPGKLGPPPPLMPAKVVGTMPGYYIFDSLKVEADGKICVGTVSKGGIAIFEPDGSKIEHVQFPQLFVTNLCFGGKDMRDVYVTGSGGTLFQGRWPRPGLKLNFNPY